MTVCTGTGTKSGNHCCYLRGKVCVFLEVDTVAGRRFSCGLRRELGSWQAVSVDARYKPIGEFWADHDLPFKYCEVWQPTKGECCREVR